MKKIKKNKIFGFLVMLILLSIGSFAYYTNTHKFFLDSGKPDLAVSLGLAQEREQDDFIVQSDVIIDTVTGLVWDKNLSRFGKQTWTDASLNCSNLNLAGRSNWDLPTRNELMTLIDEIGNSGETCTTLSSFGFIGCKTDDYYWTKSVYILNTANAWVVYFDNGGDGDYAKAIAAYVTCVARN